MRMKKCIVLTVLVFVAGIVGATQNNHIDSPDGFYQVSPEGVSRISVEGPKDKDGDYKVNAFDVISAQSEIKPGDHVAKGWWYTKTQQFYTRGYEFIVGDSRCNAWSEEGSYSFKYIPKTINISGKDVDVFKTTHDYYKNAKPSPTCINIRYYTSTCKRNVSTSYGQLIYR